MKAIDKILNQSTYRNVCPLSQVKLNRTIDSLVSFIILSAFRGDKTSSKNKTEAKRLLEDIMSSGHTFLPLFVGIVGKVTGHRVCFLIPIKKNEGAEELKELGKELTLKFNQELFLFKVDGNSSNGQFITKYGEVESSFQASNLSNIVRIYFSKIDRGSNGDRIFTHIYLKCGAKTINEHHSRTVKGEIQIIEYGSN